MYTLPPNTSLRIRHPGRHLVDWVVGVLARGAGPVGRVIDPAPSRITMELTSWVERRGWSRRGYRWYSFATGVVSPIYQEYRPFEIDPGYALVADTADDVVVYLLQFTEDQDVQIALDVARDALLEGRDTAALGILRQALPHGWPVFAALVRKERNLQGQ
jgi:hypothetical protein